MYSKLARSRVRLVEHDKTKYRVKRPKVAVSLMQKLEVAFKRQDVAPCLKMIDSPKI